jgi:hypothetical protein
VKPETKGSIGPLLLQVLGGNNNHERSRGTSTPLARGNKSERGFSSTGAGHRQKRWRVVSNEGSQRLLLPSAQNDTLLFAG